jgi:hypothetical protein
MSTQKILTVFIKVFRYTLQFFKHMTIKHAFHLRLGWKK